MIKKKHLENAFTHNFYKLTRGGGGGGGNAHSSLFKNYLYKAFSYYNIIIIQVITYMSKDAVHVNNLIFKFLFDFLFSWVEPALLSGKL